MSPAPSTLGALSFIVRTEGLVSPSSLTRGSRTPSEAICWARPRGMVCPCRRHCTLYFMATALLCKRGTAGARRSGLAAHKSCGRSGLRGGAFREGRHHCLPHSALTPPCRVVADRSGCGRCSAQTPTLHPSSVAAFIHAHHEAAPLGGRAGTERSRPELFLAS